MSKSIFIIDTPETCGDCPCHICTADEKRAIGYCHTSDEDYYCKLLDRFMEYDEVDGGIDILGKPADCPLQEQKTGHWIFCEYLSTYSREVYKCSECREKITKTGCWNHHSELEKYCPNCGAKMEEGG